MSGNSINKPLICHDLLIWDHQTHQICDAHDVHSKISLQSKSANLGHDILFI